MKNLAIGIVAILGALLAIFFSATVIVKDTELGLVHNTLTKAIRVLPNSDIYFIAFCGTKNNLLFQVLQRR
jgi:ABC-type arginine transport system permease subunit